MKVNDIVSEIKKSGKYSGISSEIINKEVEDFISKNPRYEEFKEKFIVKQIKEQLHNAYGRFQTNKKSKIKKLLEEFAETKDKEKIKQILSINLSARERIESLSWIYKSIFKITGKPKSILDLGCGLNPLSIIFSELKNPEYYAYDINEQDLEIIRKFFDIIGIEGKAESFDLRNIEGLDKLENSDICFMFKVIDPVEKNEKGHKLAEEIIQKLSQKCKHIIVSFATKTISGKPMNFPYRGWIERMLERIGLRFEIFETSSEIFYVIWK